MKKLLLLVGLVVFLTPMVVSAKKPLDEMFYCKKERQTANFKPCLPKCSMALKDPDCGYPLKCNCYIQNPNNIIDHQYGSTYTNTEFFEKGFIKKKEYEANIKKVKNLSAEELAIKIKKKKPIKICPKCKRGEKCKECQMSTSYGMICPESRKNWDYNQCYMAYGEEWERTQPKKATFKEFALSLGCGSKSKDIDDCVARYLPSIAGTGPLTLEQINEVKKDKELMGNVVFAIEAMNRAQSASPNQPPPREGAPQDQPNATSKAVWKSDSAGRWYWDYGNGFGYMPPNPQYDRILSGLSIGNQFKQQLYIGGGRGVTINSGRVNIW